MSFQGICIGRSTKNIAKYSALIELSDAISFGINCIIIRLDSQLVVLQLTSDYTIRNPTLHRLFLRVRLLERHSDFIQYQHISRNLNTLTDSLANQVLDRNLEHM